MTRRQAVDKIPAYYVQLKASLLDRVKKELESFSPTVFVFECFHGVLPFTKDKFEFSELFDACKAYRIQKNIGKEDYVVVITELEEKEGWLSTSAANLPATHAAYMDRNIFVRAQGWEPILLGCDPLYPVTYEIVANLWHDLILRAMHDKSMTVEVALQDIAHQRAIGCMNDMCDNQKEMALKMRTADICPKCQQQMERAARKEQLPDHLLQDTLAFFERLRPHMLHTNSFLPTKDLSGILPADLLPLYYACENDSQSATVYGYVEQLVKWYCLLAPNTPNNMLEMGFGNWQSLLRQAENDCIWPDLRYQAARLWQLMQEYKVVEMRNAMKQGAHLPAADMAKLPALWASLKEISEYLFCHYEFYEVKKIRRLDTNHYEAEVVFLRGDLYAQRPQTKAFQWMEAVQSDFPETDKCYVYAGPHRVWKSLQGRLTHHHCQHCGNSSLQLFHDQVFCCIH